MLTRLAVAALAVLAVACGGAGKAPKTITVGADKVPIARLVDAHAGLCEAAAHLDAARALFFDRSHESLHTVARALETVDRAGAAALLEAKQKAESGLGGPAPSLHEDLLHLADVYRTGLGRLAITTPPCVE